MGGLSQFRRSVTSAFHVVMVVCQQSAFPAVTALVAHLSVLTQVHLAPLTIARTSAGPTRSASAVFMLSATCVSTFRQSARSGVSVTIVSHSCQTLLILPLIRIALRNAKRCATRTSSVNLNVLIRHLSRRLSRRRRSWCMTLSVTSTGSKFPLATCWLQVFVWFATDIFHFWLRYFYCFENCGIVKQARHKL